MDLLRVWKADYITARACPAKLSIKTMGLRTRTTTTSRRTWAPLIGAYAEELVVNLLATYQPIRVDRRIRHFNSFDEAVKYTRSKYPFPELDAKFTKIESGFTKEFREKVIDKLGDFNSIKTQSRGSYIYTTFAIYKDFKDVIVEVKAWSPKQYDYLPYQYRNLRMEAEFLSSIEDKKCFVILPLVQKILEHEPSFSKDDERVVRECVYAKYAAMQGRTLAPSDDSADCKRCRYRELCEKIPFVEFDEIDILPLPIEFVSAKVEERDPVLWADISENQLMSAIYDLRLLYNRMNKSSIERIKRAKKWWKVRA